MFIVKHQVHRDTDKLRDTVSAKGFYKGTSLEGENEFDIKG